jgi:hypothetical protein
MVVVEGTKKLPPEEMVRMLLAAEARAARDGGAWACCQPGRDSLLALGPDGGSGVMAAEARLTPPAPGPKDGAALLVSLPDVSIGPLLDLPLPLVVLLLPDACGELEGMPPVLLFFLAGFSGEIGVTPPPVLLLFFLLAATLPAAV